MATVIDFSAAYPSPQAVKAAGHEGVMLYLSPPRETWMGGKKLTKAIVDGYKDAGLKIATCWQYGAGNARDSDVMRGAAGGRSDAEAAQKKLTEVGLPGHPCYFCCDFDITLAQWNNTAVHYFRAACDVLGRQRVGGYGHSRCVHWMMEDNVVATVAPGRVLGWVTKSWSAGATGSDYSTLYQGNHNVPGPNGVQIDINDVQHSEWGWRALPTAKEPEIDVTNLPKVDVTRWLNKHYTPGRNGQKIQYITRHHLAGIGDTDTVWGWWQTRQASAHFVVHQDGKIGQLVRESDTAWSNANSASNNVSVSIEHNNSAGAAQDWPISNTVIDAGARLAAELCLKHGLGRPQFGKNIRDHREFGSTSCPHHLANGGKYHGRWMRVAQAHYDALVSGAAGSTNTGKNTKPTKEDTLSAQAEKRIELILDQLAGPEKDKKGNYKFTGWPQLGNKTIVDSTVEQNKRIAALEKAVAALKGDK